MIKIALYFFSSTIAFVYVVVPILTIQLGFDSIIYLGKLNNFAIYQNFTLCFIPLFLALIFGRNDTHKSIALTNTVIHNNTSVFMFFIPLFWLVVFISFGGLSFRTDIQTGPIEIFFSIYPFIVILLIANLISTKNDTRLKLISKTCLLIAFILFNYLNGSRGYLLELILPFLLFYYFRLKLDGRSRFSFNLKNFRFLIFCLFIIILLSIMLSLLGVERDGTSNPLFQGLYRLSEPYWAFAYDYYDGYFNFELLSDSFYRTLSIFFRGIDYGITGSYDGKEVYLSMLYISGSEGVSLPITLIGNGYMIGGYWGAVSSVLLACFVIILVIKMIYIIPFRNNVFRLAFLLYFIAKLWNLHAKSISGVFLFLLFESIRDYLFLFIADHYISKFYFYKK